MVISHAGLMCGKLDGAETHEPGQLSDGIHGSHRTILCADELGILTKTPNGSL